MKNSSNNEMDVLLRGLAKRTASVSPSGNGEQQAAGHLDTDELNAFAERAMPPAARARYTAHLVDCSRCRKLVAELSASAGLPPTEIQVESEAGKSFWQNLPAWLSPQVLRFAVPALAILVVTVVAITTLRERRPGFVARTAETSRTEPLSKSQSDDLTLNDQATPVTSSAKTLANQNKAPATDNRVEAEAGEKAAARNEDKTSTVDSTSGLFAKDAPAPPAPSKAAEEAQPTFAPEPKPAAVAQPQAAAKTEANKNEAVKKEKKIQIDGADNQPREARDQNTAGDREGFQLSRSRKAATAGRGGAVQSVESRRSEAGRADEDEQTVSVGGRRFRKQGNVWMDTAYDSSRAAITVIRGSEQYRALVADEPGIGTIAERLAGEVIVVWKGRAYRIR